MDNKRLPAIGWAELLRFSAIETEPGARARAAKLLGLPVLPPGFFDDPEKEKAGSEKLNAPHASPIQGARKPLQAPAFWMAEPVAEPSEPEQVLSTTGVTHSHSYDANEVESWLLPSTGRVPEVPTLWGGNHPVYRRLNMGLRSLGAGVELDMARLMRRISDAQWPWPLPHRRTGRGARRLVLLLDWSERLRLFERDVAAMALECEQRFRDVTVETDAWIGGPDGYLGSNEASWANVDWGPDVLLVLISNAGGERSSQQRAWKSWLRRVSTRVGGVLVLDPCQSRVGAAQTAPIDEQLRTLLAALSPAITVEPDLLRRMRLALFPGSSALVEPLIWTHGDLVGGLPARKWRREASNKHLDHLRQLSPSLRARAARVLLEQHAHHRKVQRDEEVVRLFTVWDAAVGAEADNEQISTPDFPAALDAVGRVAQHLLHLSKGGANGQPHSRLQASAAAQSRLGRLPIDILNQRPDWLQWLTEAASQNGQEAVLPFGIQQSWASAETPEISTAFCLYQQGQRLVLQHEVSRGVSQGNPQPFGSDEASARTGDESPRVRIKSFDVVGDRVWLHLGGQTIVRMVEDFKRPYTITSRQDSGGLWSDVNLQAIRLAWRGASVTARWVRRPFGIPAWRQDDEGVWATLPTLVGDPQEVQLEPSGIRSPIEFRPPVEGDPFGRSGAVFAGVGVDAYGVYCTAEVWGKNANSMSVVRFRYIPPGTFLMGSPDGVGDDDEHPQHPVTLTEGFWMAEVPCTQLLWSTVTGNRLPIYSRSAGPVEWMTLPVEQVSFDDALLFLTMFQALLPAGVRVDLPTEAEWEYACRAGTSTVYWWGDHPHSQNANWDSNNRCATDVRQYPPNPWGLYDMLGNVWEWCSDGFRLYETEQEVVNPIGAMDTQFSVVRGGGWLSLPGDARSASRFKWLRHERDLGQGFRIILRSHSLGADPSM